MAACLWKIGARGVMNASSAGVFYTIISSSSSTFSVRSPVRASYCEGPRDRGECLAAASGHGEAVKALRHGGGFAAGVENGGPKGVDGRRAGRGGEGVHVAAEPLGELGHGRAFAPEGETLGLHESLGVEVVGVDEA